MKQECIFIPQYRTFGLRYLLSTEIIKKLSSQNFKIIMFIDMKNLNFYKKIFKDIEITFENLNSINLDKKKKKFPRLNHFFSILRKCTNGQSKEFKNNSSSINYFKIDNDLGKKKYIILILSFLLKNSKILRKLFIFVNTTFNRIFLKDDHLESSFKKYNPKLLLITSYGYDYDHYFVNIAKKFKCKVTSIVYSWDNPSSKGYKLSNSDSYLVWNQTMKKELNIFQDISKKKIHVCGVSHWDDYYKDIPNKETIMRKFYKKNNINENKKIILYFSSSPRDFSNAYKKIEEICRIIKKNKNLLLIARMHPLYLDDKICKKYLGDINLNFEKNLLNQYSENLIFKNPKLEFYGEHSNDVFYPLNDINELKDLYLSSKILLTEYSTTMLEGCIFNLPIVNIAIGKFRNTNKPIKYISEYHHLNNLKKYNAFYEVENKNQLKSCIMNLLSDKDDLLENRRKLFKKELNFFPGFSKQKFEDQIFKDINS